MALTFPVCFLIRLNHSLSQSYVMSDGLRVDCWWYASGNNTYTCKRLIKSHGLSSIGTLVFGRSYSIIRCWACSISDLTTELSVLRSYLWSTHTHSRSLITLWQRLLTVFLISNYGHATIGANINRDWLVILQAIALGTLNWLRSKLHLILDGWWRFLEGA